MRANSPNEALRQAMVAAGYTVESLSEAAGFHPKQVSRWLAEGVVPRRPEAKDKVARLVGRAEADIWPTVTHAPSASADVIDVYPHRSDVPTELWRHITTTGTEGFDILVYAGLFLPEQHPQLHAVMSAKAREGVRIRFLIGDPDCAQVAHRGVEEGIGAAISAKVRNVLALYRPLADDGSVEIRLHDTTLYASVYRADDEMLVNPHVWGLPAAHAPVMHLRRASDDGLFDTYARVVEKIWERSQAPAWADEQEVAEV